MMTTLNQIRAHSPCRDGWEQLLRGLNKTAADDEPLWIDEVLNISDLDDALWCLRAVENCDREIRLFVIWCARRVQHLMTDARSIAALDVAERHARGEASDAELSAAAAAAAVAKRAAAAAAAVAKRAAWEAAAAARAEAEEAAAVAEWAAWAAAWDAAWEAAEASARDAERAAQAEELRRICREMRGAQP